MPNNELEPRTVMGYIGGPEPNSCYLISSTWWQQNAPAWGVAALYSGAQAPWSSNSSSSCAHEDYTAQIGVANATSQGITDGNNAVSLAESRGFGPGSTPLYDDMENFNYYNVFDGVQCSSIVCAYLNGWVSSVQNAGYLAGVYGMQASECEYSLVGNSGQNLPYFIWPSNWGYSHESAWNICYDICIPNGDWVSDQRDMQYQGQLSGYNGLFTYDADCVDTTNYGGPGEATWDTGATNDISNESSSPSEDNYC